MQRTILVLVAVAVMASDALATPNWERKPQPHVRVSHDPIKVISGTYSADLAKKQFRRHLRLLRACADRELARGWAAKGTVTIDLTVVDDRVTASSVHANTLPPRPALESCLLSMMKRLRFPGTGGTLMLRVPLHFVSPPNFPLAHNPAAPEVLLDTALVAEREARNALKRAQCLKRASTRLAWLARRMKRAKRKERTRLAPQLQKARVTLTTCDLSLILNSLGTGGSQPPSFNPCVGCLGDAAQP